MKHTKLSLVLSSFLLPSLAIAESNALACKVVVQQSVKGRRLEGGQKLAPLNSAARKFSAFTLDLRKGNGQAWIHQNLCVSRGDFKNGTFEGSLCVLIMTGPERMDSTRSALGVNVARDAVSLDDRGAPGNRISKSYGGLQAVFPLNPDGQSFLYTQRFATTGAAGQLQDLTISCKAS